MQKAISKYWPVFVLPTLIAFIIGFIWPFIWGIFLSFQRFTTVSKTTFVGIQNYISVFQDSTFLHAFGFTAALMCIRDSHDADDIIDNGGTDDGGAKEALQVAQLLQGSHGDGHAGGSHNGTDEESAVELLAAQRREAVE